ncbi:MAG: DegV family protein [Moraxella sp.]|nr:DegV family protein [Moraxella sp.]
MKRIVLVTSSSSIHHLDIATGEIGIIPLHIQFGDMEFLDDNIQITPESLCQMMAGNPKIKAGTRPPTADEVHEIFADLYRRNYDEVFVVSISSRISKCYEIFQYQQSLYAGIMNVYIYDTRMGNINEGALAYEAHCMIQGGAPFSDVIKRLDALREQSVLTFSVYSLDMLIRNKKLSAPAGFVANLFDIKPVLWVDEEGYITPRDKVRKFERALREMIKFVDEQSRGKNRYIYMLDSCGVMGDLTNRCADMVMSKLNLQQLPIMPASCVSLGNHGPEGIGLGAFYGDLPKIVEKLPLFKES